MEVWWGLGSPLVVVSSGACRCLLFPHEIWRVFYFSVVTRGVVWFILYPNTVPGTYLEGEDGKEYTPFALGTPLYMMMGPSLTVVPVKMYRVWVHEWETDDSDLWEFVWWLSSTAANQPRSIYPPSPSEKCSGATVELGRRVPCRCHMLSSGQNFLLNISQDTAFEAGDGLFLYHGVEVGGDGHWRHFLWVKKV